MPISGSDGQRNQAIHDIGMQLQSMNKKFARIAEAAEKLVELFAPPAEEDAVMKQFPHEWRDHFTMSQLPAQWVGAARESEKMTEQEFRDYARELCKLNGR